LVSALKSRTAEKLCELIPLGSLDYLLERHKIGRDSSEFTIEYADATSIACEIPYVDSKYA
jgi:hypothetical protein